MGKLEGGIGPQELLAFVEHEVRNSATIIAGTAAALRCDSRIPGRPELDCQAVAHRIEEEAQSLVSFIGALATVSMEGGEHVLEPALLQHLLPKLVERISAGWVSRKVIMNIPAELPPVLANEAMLEAVVKNLLSNAEKYSPRSEPVFIDAGVDGSSVVVAVRDRGQVAAQELGRLFEMSYRSESVPADSQGSGVGLAECRALLRLMGGSISALLPEGGGFEVRFSLNRIEDVAAD